MEAHKEEVTLRKVGARVPDSKHKSQGFPVNSQENRVPEKEVKLDLKERLKSKYLGIPLFLIVTMLLSGGIAAAYVVQKITGTSEVAEPISLTVTHELGSSIYPGQSDYLEMSVSNAAPVAYTMTYTLSKSAPSGVSFTGWLDVAGDGEYDPNVGDADIQFSGTPLTASGDIAESGSQNVKIIVSASKDATPGSISLSIDVERA